MLVSSAAFIGLGCQNHRDQHDVLQQGDDQADANAGAERGTKDPAQHRSRLVTGEGDGVARIVHGVVDRFERRESCHADEDDAEQNRRDAEPQLIALNERSCGRTDQPDMRCSFVLHPRTPPHQIIVEH